MEKTFTYSRVLLAALLTLFSLSVFAQPAIIKRDVLVTNWSRPTSLITDKWGQVYFISDNWVLSFADSLGSLVTFAAGTGDAAYYGDGGPALYAGLDQPYGLCEDPRGNLYIGTRGDNRIRKVGPGGFITTLAGNGTAGYTGDGGSATLASLAGINGLWGDAAGNIYVSDSIHAVVRKIDTAGFITTFAGTGVPGYSGDGGPARSAQLGRPNGITGDAFGNIYVGDDSVNSIRKINPAGVVTTIVGGDPARGTQYGPARSALFDHLSNIWSDETGNYIYIIDAAQHSIALYERRNDDVIPFIGSPAAPTVYTSVAEDIDGNIYTADTAGSQIARLETYYGLAGIQADTVRTFLHKPYFPYITPYYNTRVTGDAYERVVDILPQEYSDDLPQGPYTFISDDAAQVSTYYGHPLSGQHYEIIPPAGQDSARDNIALYISGSDVQAYDSYVDQHQPGLPHMLNGEYRVTNLDSIVVLEFKGAGNTPDHSTGVGFEVVHARAMAFERNPEGVDPYSPYDGYYKVYVPLLPGVRNLYLTTGEIGVPLPLLTFTGTLQGMDAVLQWTTTGQVNTQLFIVERSLAGPASPSGGSAFTPIGSVPVQTGPGDQSYSFTDHHLPPGTWQFRLKMQDHTGHVTYSQLVTLTHSGIGGYSVFPNPAQDLVYIQLQADANEKWALQLTNRQGALLQTREVSLSPGINTFSFDISGLPAGSYFITGASGQKKVTTQFIK